MRAILRLAQESHNVHGVKEILKRLETYCKDRKLDDVLKTFGKPLDGSGISKIEAAVGQKLPSDFVELLKMHNGFDVSVSWSISGGPEIIGDYNVNCDLLKGGDFDDGRNDQVKAAPGVKSVWWSEKWIPFAYNGAGDCLVFDMDPASGGTKGQVVRFYHDDGDRRLLANNFVEWFDKEVEAFIDYTEKHLEKEGKASETPPAKKSWWPW